MIHPNKTDRSDCDGYSDHLWCACGLARDILSPQKLGKHPAFKDSASEGMQLELSAMRNHCPLIQFLGSACEEVPSFG